MHYTSGTAAGQRRSSSAPTRGLLTSKRANKTGIEWALLSAFLQHQKDFEEKMMVMEDRRRRRTWIEWRKSERMIESTSYVSSNCYLWVQPWVHQHHITYLQLTHLLFLSKNHCHHHLIHHQPCTQPHQPQLQLQSQNSPTIHALTHSS